MTCGPPAVRAIVLSAVPLAELRAVAANGLELELRTAKSLGHSQSLTTVTVGPLLSPD
jgi:hypothetical protein